MSACSAVPAKNRFGLWSDHPLYMHFATLFAALVAIACLILGWNNYQQGRHLVLTAATEEFERMKKESAEQIDSLHAPAEALVKWMSVSPLARAPTLDARRESLRSMAALLEMQPHITTIYMGYTNGAVSAATLAHGRRPGVFQDAAQCGLPDAKCGAQQKHRSIYGI